MVGHLRGRSWRGRTSWTLRVRLLKAGHRSGSPAVKVLVVLFRELSVCGAVEDGSDASCKPSQIIHHTNIKWESVPAMSSRIRGLRDTHRKRSRAAVGETLSWFSTPP